jgi:hypothetical protein
MDELRDRYHVGHHPPGHLADDEPACFNEWWLAANYLLVLMQEYADADDEAAYVVIGNSPAPRELLLDNGYPRMRAHVDAVLQDDPPREGVDYSEVFSADWWPTGFSVLKSAGQQPVGRVAA